MLWPSGLSPGKPRPLHAKVPAMKAPRRFLLKAAPLAALAGVALVGREAAAQASAAVPKVVWHVDFGEPRRLSALIQNVNNMVTVYQNGLLDYEVHIVFLAAGIRFVTEDALAGTPFAEDATYRAARPDLIVRLQQLRELHQVKLEVCEITAEAIGLDKKKFIPGLAVVRSGVVRIAELQSKGFAYLKVE